VRIEKLRQNYDIDIKLVHFPLHPDTPPEGREMAGFYAERGLDPDKMYQDMKERMDAEGLPYGKRTHSYNSRLAQELGKWSETVDGGEKLEKEFYKAYFVDSRNIGDVDVLLDCVEAAGLSVEDAKSVIENRTFEQAVDEDWAKSQQYGVSGVPTYVAGGYGVVGAQPYEVLEKLMQEVGAQKRG
ncbi:MAG: DsbA family oxidoreductase, partial [Alphaproteobacteria bacterium]